MPSNSINFQVLLDTVQATRAANTLEAAMRQMFGQGVSQSVPVAALNAVTNASSQAASAVSQQAQATQRARDANGRFVSSTTQAANAAAQVGVGARAASVGMNQQSQAAARVRAANGGLVTSGNQAAQAARATNTAAAAAALSLQRQAQAAGQARDAYGRFVASGNSGTTSWLSSLKALQALAGTAMGAFLVSSIKQANDAELAFLGLQSSLRGTTDSLADMWGMAKKYSKDGLMSETDAAAAIRNLRAVGYNAQEIDTLMQHLMDRAAFNREAQYSSIGEGVKTFTSALVTGNSELSNSLLMEDNLSVVEQNYIRQNGLLTTSLTQRQKAEAYKNWILKESMANEGDAARLMETSAGAVMKLERSYGQLKNTIGSELGPAATALINNILIPMTKAVGLGVTAWGELASAIKEAGKALIESKSLKEADDKFLPKLNRIGSNVMKTTEKTLDAIGLPTYPDSLDEGAFRDYTPLNKPAGTLLRAGAPRATQQSGVSGTPGTVSQANILSIVGAPPPGMPPLSAPVPGGKIITSVPAVQKPMQQNPSGQPVSVVDGPTRATQGTVDVKDPALVKKTQDALQNKRLQDEARARLESEKLDIQATKNTAEAQATILKSKIDSDTAIKDAARTRESMTDAQYARETADNELKVLDQQAEARGKLIDKTAKALQDATIANDPQAKAEYGQQLETLVAEQQAYFNARKTAAQKANTAIFEGDKATAQKTRQLNESALEMTLKAEMTLFTAKNEQELAQLENLHDQKLISEQEYLTRQAALQKAALAKEDEQAQARIDFYSKQKPLDKQDGADLASKLSDQRAIIQANAVKVTQISNDTAAKQKANAIELAKMQAELDAELADAEGRTFDAKAAQIDAWLAEKRQEFAALPDLLAKAENVASAQKKGNRFDEQQDKVSTINSDYERQQNALTRRSQQGLLTDIDLDRQSLALKKAQADALRERLALLKDNSNGSTANAQAIADLESQIADLDAAFSSTAASINEEFFSSIKQGFNDLVSGAKSFGDVLRNIVSSVLSKLANLELDQALGSLMGKTGGSAGGIGGALTNFLFGGFRAAGGDVQSGTAYVVGEEGPELYFPGVSGRIVSNKDVQSAMFGMTTKKMATPLTGRALRSDQAPAPVPHVEANIEHRVFVTTEQVRSAMRNDPGFERDIVDIVVNNHRRIQSRSQ